ncbi:MAG TPA: N-acetylmuramoyl-L-alanine amidase [Gemmatimonadales bacterium]|nr:N-acetylmuramoyl-L-alanine amidase [Gemmatimonadales bacterium]
MTGALVLTLTVLAAPGPRNVPGNVATVTISTPRGESRIPVVVGRDGAPMLPAGALATALSARLAVTGPWAELTVATLPFRFLLDAPFVTHADRIDPLVAPAYAAADTVYVPLEFVASVLPHTLVELYVWDPVAARLVERGPPVAHRPEVKRLPNGLLPGHLVVVDPGHGGVDPGNPGLYFPSGVREKDVTLSVGTLLADALRHRGIRVLMTRTTDTLINLRDRAPMCRDDCDLFLSVHVDALDPRQRRDYARVNGFHTIIIGEANTEDSRRIARMENDAARYETPTTGPNASALDFIVRDLQMNEHLREAAQLAALVQDDLSRVHPGTDRGVTQSNQLAVLNTAHRPAILVELGYSTNRSDARFMTSDSGQLKIANALADAVVSYLRGYERKTGAGMAASSP